MVDYLDVIEVQIHSLGAIGCKHICCILIINVEYENNLILSLIQDNVYNTYSYVQICKVLPLNMVRHVKIMCLAVY